MQSFAKSVRECVFLEGSLVYGREFYTKFVKSGIVGGEFCCTLIDYDRLRNSTEIC